MNVSAYRHGFRVVGSLDGDRKRVDAAAAWAGYCRIDRPQYAEAEAYLSAYCFGDDFAEHLARHGTPKGFAGPTWAPFLTFDKDCDPEEGGIEKALADTRILVDVLDETFGVPRDVPLVFFSGCKGFGLQLPTPLWLPQPGLDFHLIARKFAEMIAEEAKVVIDTGIYDRVRALRAPNSRHPKTGLHKRRVTEEQLFALTAAEVIDLARTPEPFEPPSAEGIESIDFLVAEWDRAAAAVKDQAAVAEQRRQEVAEGTKPAALNRQTRDFIRGEDVEVGSRHSRLYSAAANLAEVGCSTAAVRALLTEPALDLGLPPADVARAIDNGTLRGNPLVSRAHDALGASIVGGVNCPW
jgi:hypothetical protein